MSGSGFNLTATGFTPAYPLRVANWSVQATVTGTGAVTCDLSVQVSNDDVAYQEITTFALTGTDAATDVATVQGAYKYVKVEVEAITGTGAEVAVSIHQLAA